MTKVKLSENSNVSICNLTRDDFVLIPDSYCGCGCKSAVYIMEEGSHIIKVKTQVEYDKLPIKIDNRRFSPELEKQFQSLDTKHLKKYTPDEYLEYIRNIID